MQTQKLNAADAVRTLGKTLGNAEAGVALTEITSAYQKGETLTTHFFIFEYKGKVYEVKMIIDNLYGSITQVFSDETKDTFSFSYCPYTLEMDDEADENYFNRNYINLVNRYMELVYGK